MTTVRAAGSSLPIRRSVFGGTLSEDLDASDGTASITITGPLDGGPDLPANPPEVGNSNGYDGLTGDIATIRTTANDSDLTAAVAWEIISLFPSNTKQSSGSGMGSRRTSIAPRAIPASGSRWWTPAAIAA